LGEWWEALIFPVFSIAMVWFIGRQLGFWEKVEHWFNSRGSGGFDLGSLLAGFRQLSWEGIAKFFRRDQ